MLPRTIFKLTRLPAQAAICALAASAADVAIYYGNRSGADITGLDRSTFIGALSAVATLVALFCSLSIAWILSVSQQSKSERLSTYDLFKSSLREAKSWLHSLEQTEDRELCLSLAYELDKLDLSDLPQTDLGPEYAAYCKALEAGLESEDEEQREFYFRTTTHFTYIESLLNRIGIISIRQILTRLFIDTLAKGVALVAVSVVILSVSFLWFSEAVKPALVMSAIFIACGSALLLLEVWVDLRRYYDEELDFIEPSPAEA
jgi:hypothetical protein